MSALARQPRSRLDRPCDLCRRHKHMCNRPVRGEPCLGCQGRGKACTYDMAPTKRKRRPREPRSTAVSTSIQPTSGTDTTRQSPSVDLGGLFETEDPPLTELTDASDTESLPMHPHSLDIDDSTGEESHFLGAAGSTNFYIHSNLVVDRGSFTFRQVSLDPTLPVYFVKYPSLMYGRSSMTAESALDASRQILGPQWQELLSRGIHFLGHDFIPAVPFINLKRLEMSCAGLTQSGPVPHALLAGINAFSAVYIDDIRPLHTDLWHQALHALDDEFRQPRLSTLQLALLQAYSLPKNGVENAGQVSITMARTVGAAHLLGLHLDPSNWTLPRWERGLRKRIWWAILIQDKWRALIHGRPSSIHRKDCNVPLPTIEDGDWGRHAPPHHKLSFQSFIAMCRLTLIVDDVLDSFFVVNQSAHTTPMTRVSMIEQLIDRLHTVHGQSPELQLSPQESPPTGIRSYQLSYLGLHVLLRRLLLDSMSQPSLLLERALLESGLETAQQVVTWLADVTAVPTQYWSTQSSHHIANTGTLLGRIATKASEHPDIQRSAIESLSQLTRYVIESKAKGWIVAHLALNRLLHLTASLENDLPDILPISEDILTALGRSRPTEPTSLSLDDILDMVNMGGLDSMSWFESQNDNDSWWNEGIINGRDS